MPVGVFCAFLGSFRLVRYLPAFLGHANIRKVNFLETLFPNVPGVEGVSGFIAFMEKAKASA